ncbi:MAG: hypothetical protein ABI480_08915 [Chitinophagaceae bacterium]
MNTILNISPNKFIHTLRDEFSTVYPFLNLEFYKLQEGDPNLVIRKHIPHQGLLRIAGLKIHGDIELNDSMRVGELEKEFREKFGLNVQVTRQSGSIWLETTMTDKWTLRQQNEHGREITKGRDHSGNSMEEFDLSKGTSD